MIQIQHMFVNTIYNWLSNIHQGGRKRGFITRGREEKKKRVLGKKEINEELNKGKKGDKEGTK